MNYNLIDEPWLPCLLPDGTPREFGLRDALVRAAEIRELRDISPLVTAALYRLLLALLHRVFDGPHSLHAWKKLWNVGCFDALALDEYFKRWRGRFDLFDTEFPFFQCPSIPDDIKTSGIARLAPELANGGEASAHFNHEADDTAFAVNLSVVARWLVAHQATAFGGTKGGGRGSYCDAPMTRGLILLAEGTSLFHTLMLNLIQYDGSRPFPRISEDKPSWELGPQPMGRNRLPFGYLDYLTWQSRAIYLEPPEDSRRPAVRSCRYYEGQILQPPIPDLDPMMAYFYDKTDKKLPIKSLRLEGERAVWRDSEALFAMDPKSTQAAWKRPRSFDMLASLVSQGAIPKEAASRVMVCGWDSKAGHAKVNFWRHERLPFPLEYLSDQDLVGDLKKVLFFAEDVARKLHLAARHAVKVLLSPANPRKADANRVKSVMKSLAPQRLYWSKLEEPYRRLLETLPGDELTQADSAQYAAHRITRLCEWFLNTLKPAAIDAYRRTAGELEWSARGARAVVEGEDWLNHFLGAIAKENHFTNTPKTQGTTDVTS